MRSPQRLVVMVALALLAVFAGWYILTTPGLKPVVISVYQPPIIYAEQRIQDVGQVPSDSKVHAVFLLYNKGGRHLRISDVDTSCGCTVANISKKVVAPGDYTRLDVDMDTSLKQGKVRKEITVHSNDPDRPDLSLFLTGDVQVKAMQGHSQIELKAKDPLVLFKGECATCHVSQGKGKSGKALFQADCAMCHGVTAQGNGNAGPTLLKMDYEKEATLAQIRAVIADGSPHSPQMPPFSQKKGGPLTDGEIDSLVSFLKFQALQKKMGLLNEESGEMENEPAFQQALKQPH